MIRAAIKRLGRPVVAALAHYGGYCALAGRLRDRRSGRILSYHGISDRPDTPYTVASADFGRQMAYLAEHSTPLPVDEMVQRLTTGEALPPRAVAVTFDDGYRDAYTHVYPILQRHGIPATVFLPVAFLDGGRSEAAAERLGRADFLTWDQVLEMSRGGVTFGSHTVNHLRLTTLPPQALRDELVRSRSELEAKLGRPATGLAYPYGTVRAFNPAVMRAAAEAGYLWAVTGVSGLNSPRTNRFALRRTKIERHDSLELFARALAGALDPWVIVDRLGRFLK